MGPRRARRALRGRARSIHVAAVTGDEEIEAHLGAVFDELVDLVGEVKQAVWTASSPERRQAFDELKLFLGGQAAIVDDAEQRLGGRPPGGGSATGHPAPP